MHVLVTSPTAWPHVRRGAEREVHDLGVRLRARGHRVRQLAGAPPGMPRRGDSEGLPTTWVPLPVPGALARRGWSPETAVALPAAVAGALARADLVHAFHYADAAGVALGQRWARRRRPLVLKLTGTVLPDRVAALRVDAALLRRALALADEVWVNSAYAVDAMAGWRVPMRVVPAGLDATAFRLGTAPRSEVPTVVCAQAPTDPRKRLVDVVDAWPAVLDAVPGARLRLAGRAPEEVRVRLLDRLPAAARASVAFLGDLGDAALAAEYAAAWVVAAPSVHEALGLTVLEALACGTPVAGARSGATPELLAAPGAGWLFEPVDPADCARALAVALAAPPADPAACAAAAAPWSWDGSGGVVDRVLERYRALLPGSA